MNLIKQSADMIRAELQKENEALTAAELSSRTEMTENLVRRGLDVLMFVGEVQEKARARNARRRGAVPRVYSLIAPIQ